MKLFVPVGEYRGLESEVHGHFGSAPCFALVDTETMVAEPVSNSGAHHEHGSCRPLQALAGHEVDAVLVGGIGYGALSALRQAGLQVFQAPTGTVAEALELLRAGRLETIGERGTCAGHGSGGGCHGH